MQVKLMSMIKFYYYSVKGIASFLLLLTCLQSFAIAPKWSTGFPQAINGATSIDLTFNTDQNSSIYYVVYNAIPTNFTPATIKADARAAIGGAISKNGIASVKSSISSKIFITGLSDGKTYYVFAVAENTNGELQGANDIKQYNLVLPARQSVNTYRTGFANGIVGYYAYFPEQYYKNPSANYPVLFFLHGSGEKAGSMENTNSISSVKYHGPPKLIDQGQEFPFIVISPQCPFATWDHAGEVERPGYFVDEIVEMVKSKYRIDQNKMYITGLSMGGAGTFSYIQNFPGKMAAAIPIAGWGDPTKSCALKDLALWVFQGQYDGGQSISDLVTYINECKPAGAEQAKATIYQGGGHDAWTATYNNTGYGIAPDNIYDWLMRHSKNSATNQNPTTNAGPDSFATLPTTALTLNGSGSDIDGSIVSYNWTQVSGPTIVITNATNAIASIKPIAEGTYGFRLTVKDNLGATSYDDVIITINPAPVVNTLPVTNAGVDKSVTLPVSSVNLVGSATDTDGNIISYVWAQLNGPSATITNANTSTIILSNLFVGTYTFRCTATDNKGGTSHDDMILNVYPAAVAAPLPAILGISNIVLADADKSVELVNFPNGSTLDLSAYPNTKNFTFLAKTTSTEIKSIVFTLDGSTFRIENDAPFSMTGNCYPGYNCYNAYWRPSVGLHTITATAYSVANGKRTNEGSVSVTFNVVDNKIITAPVATAGIISLALANADKSTEISNLSDGSTVNLSALGVRNYTVLAKCGENPIGSIVWHLDGGLFRIEDNAPFSLTGNCYPGYECYGAYWQPSVGVHTVTGTAYSLDGGAGVKLNSITTRFNVVSTSSRITSDESVSSLEVSPNPFVNDLNISLASSSSENLDISLLDAHGLIVYQSINVGGNQNGISINLSDLNLNSGLYVLKVVSENGETRTTKVIKQ